MTFAEYEKLLNPEPTDSDCAALFHKGAESGSYAHLTKGDYAELLQGIAGEIQEPNETFQCAYARAVEKTATGRALFAAMKMAPESVTRLPAKHKILAEIQKRADERFPDLPTPQRRFAHAIDTDKYGRPYDKAAHVLDEAAKSAPGHDTPPSAPEPAADIMKSDAAVRGSAHAQMLELARAHNAANPKLSPEQSYAAVYTWPQNVGLKAQLAGESLALWNGDSTMQGDTAYAEQMRAPYQNPHVPQVRSPRAGSGPRV